ncbi:MAG: hypothetical protein JNG83_07580 [Opitutaceae bacterium]|nr:hypothetical protein [Opitutaceae bacterium]
MPNPVKIYDSNRSYVRWCVDTVAKPPRTVSHKPPFTLNHVRVRSECLAEVTDRRTGRTTPYLLGASCKTEHVNVDRDIWTQPNADFCMIAGPDQFLALKRWDKTNKGVMLYPPSLGPQPERHLVNPAEAFTVFAADIRRVDARKVDDIDDLNAVLASEQTVVSRTRIEAKHYTLTLEYPAVTANFSPRERYYQLDTGPVLLPDLDAAPDAVLGTFRLAYVAHIKPDWAEFLLSVPTPLTPDISVHHYSQSVRVTCVNEMYALL